MDKPVKVCCAQIGWALQLLLVCRGCLVSSPYFLAELT